ncbi:hypothetical protein E2C01_020198 [Portunus trituberculatus]|uniref:Uncharacterized protein n=1 Tax=Portunus trituberculatus TaxID=210409 RepID=A0A5B7E1M9_PORTR|nr:hypothetical protein [Portunus trituberculatus]
MIISTIVSDSLTVTDNAICQQNWCVAYKQRSMFLNVKYWDLIMI